MARQVLFAQGAGKGTHDEWDDKLVQSLRKNLGDGWSVLYPRMPGEGDPKFSAWKATLLREFQNLREGDVLVGHSFGGAVLLHAITEEALPFRPSALVLLATPFYGDDGWDGADLELPPDFTRRLPDSLAIRLYHGNRDDTVPFHHLELYRKAIPRALTTEVPDGDHQFNDDLAEVARDIKAC